MYSGNEARFGGKKCYLILKKYGENLQASDVKGVRPG